MKINNNDNDAIRFLALEIYQQAEYIKDKDSSKKEFNAHFEAGILFAYAEVLNSISHFIRDNNINIDDLFEGGFKPYEVLQFRPKNWQKEKNLLD